MSTNNVASQALNQAGEIIDFFDQHVAPHVGLDTKPPAEKDKPTIRSVEENLAEARAALATETQLRVDAEAASKRNAIVGLGVGLALGWAIKKYAV